MGANVAAAQYGRRSVRRRQSGRVNSGVDKTIFLCPDHSRRLTRRRFDRAVAVERLLLLMNGLHHSVKLLKYNKNLKRPDLILTKKSECLDRLLKYRKKQFAHVINVFKDLDKHQYVSCLKKTVLDPQSHNLQTTH
uniref:Uncharacterized protein n=1 Tax=Romanomermis culicivorax TaxID=13658 RepID=A0A915IBL5_ROMCU